MARIYFDTITADGDIIVNLNNIRGERNIYTVQASDDFGGGTLTAFTNGFGDAGSGTDNDIPILDSSANPISLTDNGSFDFQCNSGTVSTPNVLKLVLTGSTNPSLNIRVDNAA